MNPFPLSSQPLYFAFPSDEGVEQDGAQALPKVGVQGASKRARDTQNHTGLPLKIQTGLPPIP